MLKLKDTETYSGNKLYTMDGEMKKAPRSLEELNVLMASGHIPISAIEESLEKIKKTPMYADAEKYLRDGKIVLLCPQGSNGEYLLSIHIPFFVVGNKMYVNLVKRGRWSEDKTSYIISPASELAPILQAAYITYRLIENADKLFKDPVVVEASTRVYVEIFLGLLQKFGIIINDGSQDDNTTYLRYLCAKFFLLYILEKPFGPSVDEMAYKVGKNTPTNRTPLDLLQMREDGDGFIDSPEKYTSLCSFLESIMITMRSNIEIKGPNVRSAFMFIYGEEPWHGITYFPYLIYWLMVASNGGPPTRLRNKLMSMKALTPRIHQLAKEIMAKS